MFPCWSSPACAAIRRPPGAISWRLSGWWAFFVLRFYDLRFYDQCMEAPLNPVWSLQLSCDTRSM